MHTTQQKGFTLIELLVVIAIIGILSSVVLASMNSARKKSRDARRMRDLKAMQTALELLFDANKTYPLTTSGAEVVVSSSQITSFMSYIPKDPSAPASPAATDRQYWYAGAAESYCLGAVLEGTPGSKDGCSGTVSTDVTDGIDGITGYNASTAVGTGNVLKVSGI